METLFFFVLSPSSSWPLLPPLKNFLSSPYLPLSVSRNSSSQAEERPVPIRPFQTDPPSTKTSRVVPGGTPFCFGSTVHKSKRSPLNICMVDGPLDDRCSVSRGIKILKFERKGESYKFVLSPSARPRERRDRTGYGGDFGSERRTYCPSLPLPFLHLSFV